MSKIKSWWQQRPPGVGAVVLLIIGVVIGVAAAEWMMAPQEKLIPMKLANGQVIYETPADAQSEAVTGADFSWDFTKVQHPDEPRLPTPQPIPSR
jgi:hypothetical protein